MQLHVGKLNAKDKRMIRVDSKPGLYHLVENPEMVIAQLSIMNPVAYRRNKNHVSKKYIQEHNFQQQHQIPKSLQRSF